MTEAEKRIREALSVASLEPRDERFKVDTDDLTALLADRDDREAALRAELAHEEQRVADMMADVNRVGHENDALRAEVEALKSDNDSYREAANGYLAEAEALRALLIEAGDELVCGGITGVRADSDEEWQESHWCPRCDSSVDRHWETRTKIRAALAQIEQERSEQAKDAQIEQAKKSDGLRPCRSPYCECEQGKCTHPGYYDARHLPITEKSTK